MADTLKPNSDKTWLTGAQIRMPANGVSDLRSRLGKPSNSLVKAGQELGGIRPLDTDVTGQVLTTRNLHEADWDSGILFHTGSKTKTLSNAAFFSALTGISRTVSIGQPKISAPTRSIGGLSL